MKQLFSKKIILELLRDITPEPSFFTFASKDNYSNLVGNIGVRIDFKFGDKNYALLATLGGNTQNMFRYKMHDVTKESVINTPHKEKWYESIKASLNTINTKLLDLYKLGISEVFLI